MECNCSSHTIYEDFHPRTSRLLEQEHHVASLQLGEYSEDTIYVKAMNHSLSALGVLEDLQLLGYESSRTCQTRSHGIPGVAWFYTRYRIGNITYRYTK